MIRTVLTSTLSIGLALACTGAADAADVQVKLLNAGAAGAMVFEPAFVHVEPGDTVHFVPVDKGHNVVTIPGMLPAGTAALRGETSQPYDVTFTTPGLYGLQCTPHYALGMVAVVVVGGRPANLARAQAVVAPGLAQARLAPLLAQAGAVADAKSAPKTKAARHRRQA